MTESITPTYPDALSRDFSEGGYTFLHRIFRKNIDSGRPVVIKTGEMYFQYQYQPGQQSFEEGLTLLEGDKNSETMELFMGVVKSFGLDVAISEGGYTKNASGELSKSNVRRFKFPWSK